MSQKKIFLTVRVRVAWWVRPYLYALGFVAVTMGREPDWQKFEAVVRKGIKVTLE